MPVEEIAGRIAGKAAEKTPSWVERILVPSLEGIKGELKAVNIRIDSTNERIDSLRNEMNSKFEAADIRITGFDEKLGSFRNETKSEFAALHYRLDSIEKSIPVIEKVAALELKIAELEKRLSVA